MKRIDEFPTHEINGIKYRQGHSLPFGASVTASGGINFSVSSRDAYSAELVLFHNGEKKPFAIIPFHEEFRIGSNFSMIVFGLDIEDIEYGYRFDGPYDTEKGYWFDKSKTLLDPWEWRLMS